MIHNFFKINIPKMSPDSKLTQHEAYTLKFEIKLNLCIYRNSISINIFSCQRLLANTHSSSRPCIQKIVEEKLNVTFKIKYIDKVVLRRVYFCFTY